VVTDVRPCARAIAADELLALAAAAEARLTHPVATAIVRAAQERALSIPERQSSEYTIGQGVSAVVDGVEVLAGSCRFLSARGVDTDFAGNGWPLVGSSLYVAAAGRVVGCIIYSDPLRPEAAEVVRTLRARGIDRIIMLTGDHRTVAQAVAEAVGVTCFASEMLPEQKAEYVRALQREGRTVAVVGDGINDSLCLAQADVGIAVHGASDVARDTSHIALLEESLWKVPQAIDIAREAIGLIHQNWRINFYPNCAAIGLTLCRLTGPIATTLISNGAAVLATLNALRPLMSG
jgi:Cu2+-exporting ATPase